MSWETLLFFFLRKMESKWRCKQKFGMNCKRPKHPLTFNTLVHKPNNFCASCTLCSSVSYVKMYQNCSLIYQRERSKTLGFRILGVHTGPKKALLLQRNTKAVPLTWSLLLRSCSPSMLRYGVLPTEARYRASSSLTRERMVSARCSLLLSSSFWIFSMLFSSCCITVNHKLYLKISIEHWIEYQNAWKRTCLDFGMMMNALLEVLLTR